MIKFILLLICYVYTYFNLNLFIFSKEVKYLPTYLISYPGIWVNLHRTLKKYITQKIKG